MAYPICKKIQQITSMDQMIKQRKIIHCVLSGVLTFSGMSVMATDFTTHTSNNSAQHLAQVTSSSSIPASSHKTSSNKNTAWNDIISDAKGKTVYFHAWGGDAKINGYIRWVASELERQFDIRLIHAKANDTGNIIATLIAEKAAGRIENGRVDLMWINGENFHSMKQADLLFGPFTQHLPNTVWIDTKNKPATVMDFTVPTQGFESPWGYAQLTFFYDSAQLTNPPKSVKQLLDWAKKNPGRFAYPAPPDFIGTTFLKQIMLELNTDHSSFQQSPSDELFASVSKQVWKYLDRLHPVLWRSGRTYPINAPSLRQMLGDGEIDIAFSFNPADAVSAISQGMLPDTVRPYIFSKGTIANAHFVAIPYNSSVKSASMVTANFLLSPKAQAHKANPNIWGDTTVLSITRLTPIQQQAFTATSSSDKKLSNSPSSTRVSSTHLLTDDELQQTLNEPHPDWTIKLEREWLKRYGR